MIKRYALRFVGGNKLIIPSNVKTLNYVALNQCYAKEVILNEGLESIMDIALSNTKFTDISIPSSVTYIGHRVFDCAIVFNINIGSGASKIENDAFKKKAMYTQISSITINKKVNTIEGSPWSANEATVKWTGNE